MMIVGMSGGVDSSVTALLLKRRGEDVRGVFMKNWETEDGVECRSEEDRRDALRVCGMLDIPFSFRNFAAQYRAQVFDAFLSGYAHGFTPNPDILCNREVKFKVFLDDALAQGAERIATGHYARREKNGSVWSLLRGRDPGKDQSYFLHAMGQDALSRTEFPIGDLPKAEVRRLAAEAGLLTAKKKDSTGICFIGEQDFRTFLSRYLPAQNGQIVTDDGRVIGEHHGALYYTVGQRAPVGGVKGMDTRPWFVARKDVVNNQLIVVQGHDHPALFTRQVRTDVMSWIEGQAPSTSFAADIQIRHLGLPEKGEVEVMDDGTLTVTFDRPVRAVAMGQSAAIYWGDRCLGGAMMTHTMA